MNESEIKINNKKTKNDLMKTYNIFRDKDKTKEWVFLNNYIFPNKKCYKCNNKMILCKEKKGSDRFKCKKCSYSVSIKRLTPFGFSRIHLNVILMIYLFQWIELNITQASILTGVSENTISRLWIFSRRCCEMELEKSTKMIGGEGVEVEIDEAAFKRRKYKKGRRKKLIWVFGMVERKKSNIFKVFIVKKRNKDVLIPLINKFIKPGSIIYSDEWKAYNYIDNKIYTHKTINHSKSFAKKEINTNHIENLWEN